MPVPVEGPATIWALARRAALVLAPLLLGGCASLHGSGGEVLGAALLGAACLWGLTYHPGGVR